MGSSPRNQSLKLSKVGAVYSTSTIDSKVHTIIPKIFNKYRSIFELVLLVLQSKLITKC
ncbi:hypothetical protein Plhal304r1_c010g0038721 [Plasmopara halstedii]